MFEKLATIFMTALGIQAFSKNADGKSELTEDQKTKLEGLFGKEAIEKFSIKMANEKPAASADDDAEDLMASIRDHNATTVATQLQEMQQQLAQANRDKETLQATVLQLSSEPEETPKPEGTATVAGKPGVAPVMKVKMNNSIYRHYAGVLQHGTLIGANNATIDVVDIKDEFGTYLSQNANNLELVRQLFKDFTSARYFRSVLATTEYQAMQALINSVVQQFTPKWTPAGNTKFTPLVIPNRRHKINFPIIPAEVLDSYLMHLYDERLSPDQMPITKYIWQNLLYPQILEDIELRMLGKGKYNPVQWSSVTEGQAGGPPEDGMDGVETILVEQKALGSSSKVNFFNPTNTSFDFTTASDQEVLDFVEEYVDWISPFYRSRAMNIHCSHEFWKRYQRAYKKIWGMNSGQSGDFGSNRVDFSAQTLVPLDCLYGSPILWSTPAENQVKLRHKNEVPMVINDVQKVNYEVRLFGEFWFAAGFAIAEAVFAYVPDGYNPQTVLTNTHGASTKFRDGSDPRTEAQIYAGMPAGTSSDPGSDDGSDGGGI